jgi:hypothetical protein
MWSGSILLVSLLRIFGFFLLPFYTIFDLLLL